MDSIALTFTSGCVARMDIATESIDHSQGGAPIFLLSMPRSGSTLLSMMLASHPEICCPPEPWVALVVAEYLGIGDIRGLPYGRESAEIAAVEFLLGPENRQRGVLGTTLSAIVETLSLDRKVAARVILQAVYRMHLDVSGKSLFVDKTPRYYALLALLDELFPGSERIVLLRNPLDIYASYKTTWEISRGIFTPDGVSVHTRDFCEGLFALAEYAASPGDNVLVLRYEDLVSNPEHVLRSFCEFKGVNYSPAMLTYFDNTTLIEEYRRSPVGDPVSSSGPTPANSRSVNSWERRLELADIQALVNILGVDIFVRLGYGDAVVSFRDMPLSIPTEQQAHESRQELMQSLVARVQESPFSTWKNFVLPLRDSLADRAARLEVILAQQDELVRLRQSLQVSEADRAARLEAIVTQQDELARLRQSLEIFEADKPLIGGVMPPESLK